jgi:hypothetical protein
VQFSGKLCTCNMKCTLVCVEGQGLGRDDCGLFLRCCHCVGYTVSVGSMMNWKDLNGGGNSLIEIIYLRLPGRLRKTTKPSVSIAGVPIEIGTESLPNSSQERKPFGWRYFL